MNRKSTPWMESVRQQTRLQYNGSPLEGPVQLSATFHLPRPKNHYRTGRFSTQLRPKAAYHKTTAPDLSKLVRCLEDALTGLVWCDDRQVARYKDIAKVFTCRDPYTTVVVETIADHIPEFEPTTKTTRPAPF